MMLRSVAKLVMNSNFSSLLLSIPTNHGRVRVSTSKCALLEMNREERRALSVALSRRGDLLASVAAVATMLQVSWWRSSLALFVVFVMYDRI